MRKKLAGRTERLEHLASGKVAYDAEEGVDYIWTSADRINDVVRAREDEFWVDEDTLEESSEPDKERIHE